MTIDLAAIVRRRKPERHRRPLHPRAPSDLVGVDTFARIGGRPALVPDTSVYIHAAAGRLGPSARSLTEGALLSHCSVCLAELAVGLANRDITSANWPNELRHFEELFARVQATRMLVPDDKVWADAGIVAGTLARIQNFQANQRKECLNDALIYLSATKAGLPVLTSNRGQFDLLQQLAPEGGFIFYEPL